MIIVAIINASAIRTSVDSFNLVWKIFWQHVEACAAVLMVSFTAFRSLFLSKRLNKEKGNDRPGIFQRLRTWLSAKTVSRGDVKNLSPSPQPDAAPPHATLGPPFHSLEQRGLFGSQLQPLSQSASSHSQDPESGFQEEPKDLESLVAQDQETKSSGGIAAKRREHLLGKHILPFSGSQSKKPPHGGHWWQMGIISNFTLSRSQGLDSEF